ncbi:MAG: YmdB family metallophosphoesterase [Candidatus Babeliaceae bacterium]|nr:YmdB family metallophosphoesterase [Candidatus Babeliaceae bacterium]
METVRILCFGDLLGAPGCALFQKYAQQLKRAYNAQAIIVNGENAATNGRGISPKQVEMLRHAGAAMITGGNHIFQQKDILLFFDQQGPNPYLLRPANFPSICPGRGIGIVSLDDGTKIGVINVQGRVFMQQHLDCPFRAVETALSFLRTQTPIIIIDFHAEASSEKAGMGFFCDGKVSAVVGTHTHVQTADERIFPRRTAFISDLGMTGARDSMIGMKVGTVLPHLLSQMPGRFEVENKGPFVVSGVCLEVEKETGRACSIERVSVLDEDFSF